MMKVFQRAIRRAGLDAEYSKGFNPQMQMVFGLPMQVGMTSTGEYGDFGFETEYSPDFIISSLGKALPPGLNIISAGIRNIKRNIMADVSYALYRIEFNLPTEKIYDFINESEQIMVLKKTKHTEKETDIRPYIIKTEKRNDNELTFLLKAGQVNLNTRTLINSLKDNISYEIEAVRTHREQLFVQRENKLCDPLDEKALNTEW